MGSSMETSAQSGPIGRRRFGLEAVKLAPDAADQAEAIAPGALGRALMPIGRAEPGAGDPHHRFVHDVRLDEPSLRGEVAALMARKSSPGMSGKPWKLAMLANLERQVSNRLSHPARTVKASPAVNGLQRGLLQHQHHAGYAGEMAGDGLQRALVGAAGPSQEAVRKPACGEGVQPCHGQPAVVRADALTVPAPLNAAPETSARHRPSPSRASQSRL